MKLTYRPEIDGLRCISVISILLYHAQFKIYDQKIFTGGFIGVDIFFVISGYLITYLILKELDLNNKFSFLNFYERRARRILPALFVVILVSLPFAYFFLLPNSLVEFAYSLLFSLGFSSNFFFLNIGQIYGAESSLLKPFLHTWSLAVEEQYYLLFPILLIFFYKYFKKNLLLLFLLGVLASLLIANWAAYRIPSVNFYILPTRGWELLFGSIIAYIDIKKYRIPKNKLTDFLLPATGIILIFYSIFLFDSSTKHPSFLTLIPVVGVSLLIIFLRERSSFIYKLLSSKLFVSIGLISYSLYLWHYPIFAFGRAMNSDPTIFEKILWIILSFVLSTLSYLFIEKKFRDKKLISSKLFINSLIVTSLIIIITNLKTIDDNGYIKRLPEILMKNEINSEYRQVKQNGWRCHNRPGHSGFCSFNIKNNHKIYFLADSISDALLKDFIKKAKIHNLKVTHMSYAGNLYFPNFVKVNRKTNKVVIGDKVHEFRKEKIFSEPKNSYIVIAGLYTYYFKEKEYYLEDNKIKSKDAKFFYTKKNNFEFNKEIRINKLKNSFKEGILDFANKGIKVILLYPLPQSSEHVSKKIFSYYSAFDKNNQNFFKNLNNSDLHLDYGLFKKQNEEIFDFFNQIKHQNIYKIYPHKLFCNTKIKNKCIFHSKNTIFLFDKVHPSYSGSSLINQLIIEKINEIRNSN